MAIAHRSRSGPAARLAKLEEYKVKADAELANKEVRREKYRKAVAALEAEKDQRRKYIASLAFALGVLADPADDCLLAAAVLGAAKLVCDENVRLKAEIEDLLLSGKAVVS